MEKNFNKLTTEELKKLQDLIATEIVNRNNEKRKNARNKIRELLNEIEKICIDNNFNFYYTDNYGNDYEVDLLNNIYIC